MMLGLALADTVSLIVSPSSAVVGPKNIIYQILIEERLKSPYKLFFLITWNTCKLWSVLYVKIN